MHTMVTSFITLIGCSFIVCLILITPIELQELCIKLAFPSQIRYWLLGVRFSLRYNLPSGWNATMKLHFFSDQSSLVLPNNVSCLQMLQ